MRPANKKTQRELQRRFAAYSKRREQKERQQARAGGDQNHPADHSQHPHAPETPNQPNNPKLPI